jgi:glycosyltransferase involved in cell wall biosynthesis
MKTLVLVTSQFPFGTGESFIGSEFPVLSRSFEKIIIIAQNVSGERTRSMNGNVAVYRYNPATSLIGFLQLPFLILINADTIFRLFKEESDFRKSTGHDLSKKNVSLLLKKIIKAIQLRNFIRQAMIKEEVNESLVFYSYWLKTGAHAISLLDFKNSIKIARAHGSDIYEEKTLSGYLPLLRFSALNLDAIFFVSKNGKEYIRERTKTEGQNFFVSYLGVGKSESGTERISTSDTFVIVSCSNMVALKRIDLIIKSLQIVKSDTDIEWLHFGDGILKNELTKLAESRLKPLKKVSYRFMGYFPNDELLRYYQSNRVDLFINTSSTEGVPVSMMEAQSYGIPVVATDIGGVKEIVTEGTGSLLPVDFKPEDLKRLIEYYITLTDEESEIIRMNVIKNWNLKFNAISNYEDFLMKVNSILASCKEQTQSI